MWSVYQISFSYLLKHSYLKSQLHKANYETWFPKTCLTHRAFPIPTPPPLCPQMFLQVWSSGSSHEEAHLERGQHQPSNAAKGKVVRVGKKKHETNAVSRPVSWLNCPRAEWRGCVPAKACHFAPYWNPVPAGPLFGERRSEGCLLQREYKIMDGEEVFLIEMDLHTKKDKKKIKDKQKEWMICMYGAWCFGDISRTADTLVLYRTVWGEHVCTVNVCDWLTGPPKRDKKTFLGMRDGLVNGFWGKCSTCVFPPDGSVTMVQDGSSCLSWGVGRSSEAFEALGLIGERRWMCFLVSDPGTKTPSPPPGHCMTGASLFFFGVFGAATKCAMCYVAWFIIFFTSYKAHL